MPVYPPAAVSAALEGDVTLAGVIGIDGRVSNITVLRSSHPLLNEAARKAWLQYEYKPGRSERGGRTDALPQDVHIQASVDSALRRRRVSALSLNRL